MDRKLLIQYPDYKAEDRNGTIFENVVFDENKCSELNQELQSLAKNLYDSKIVKSVSISADKEKQIIFINVIVDDLDQIDKERGCNVYDESSEEGLATYLYNLAIIILYGYDYYIRVRIYKEV